MENKLINDDVTHRDLEFVVEVRFVFAENCRTRRSISNLSVAVGASY